MTLRIRPNPWTDEQTARARQLLSAGATNEAYVAEIGRTKAAAYSHILYMDDPEGYKAKRNRKRVSRAKTVGAKVQNTDRFFIPDDVIAAAVRRSSAERSITARLMGDPPIGFSALDRRQAEASI